MYASLPVLAVWGFIKAERKPKDVKGASPGEEKCDACDKGAGSGRAGGRSPGPSRTRPEYRDRK